VHWREWISVDDLLGNQKEYEGSLTTDGTSVHLLYTITRERGLETRSAPPASVAAAVSNCIGKVHTMRKAC
jgi:hypothetical protein